MTTFNAKMKSGPTLGSLLTLVQEWIEDWYTVVLVNEENLELHIYSYDDTEMIGAYLSPDGGRSIIDDGEWSVRGGWKEELLEQFKLDPNSRWFVDKRIFKSLQNLRDRTWAIQEKLEKYTKEWQG